MKILINSVQVSLGNCTWSLLLLIFYTSGSSLWDGLPHRTLGTHCHGFFTLAQVISSFFCRGKFKHKKTLKDVLSRSLDDCKWSIGASKASCLYLTLLSQPLTPTHGFFPAPPWKAQACKHTLPIEHAIEGYELMCAFYCLGEIHIPKWLSQLSKSEKIARGGLVLQGKYLIIFSAYCLL